MNLRLRSLLGACLMLAGVLGLAACGGGSLVAGGVGSGGSGVAEGTVSGFGSVIVEGVAYNDSQAALLRGRADAALENAEVKLGQRVRIEHANQVASRILVLPQLRGSAASAADAHGRFLLLGQQVRIVSSSSDGLPVTVLEGLSTVTAGDALEVHGSWARESGRSVLVASRIEKLPAAPDPVLLTAPVAARNAATLVLDDAAQTVVKPPTLPDSVQAGSLVSLWIARAVTQVPGTATQPWVALRAEDAAPSAVEGTLLNLAAVVSTTDAAAGRLSVQGLSVRLPADWQGAAPADGTPVLLQIVRQGGEWVASRVSVVRASDVAPVQLRGVTTWRAGGSSLRLRDTLVLLPAAAVGASCAGLQAGDPVYIELTAERRDQGQALQATHVECTRQIPVSSVQDATGTLLSVDAAARTLVVRVAGTDLNLSWTANSYQPAGLTGLIGQSVDLEYESAAGSYVLRKLKPASP